MTLLHSNHWHHEVTLFYISDSIKTTVNNIDSMTLVNSTTDIIETTVNNIMSLYH